jgi:hypothetical protein
MALNLGVLPECLDLEDHKEWKEAGKSPVMRDLISSWSGKLATPSDPYFQNPTNSALPITEPPKDLSQNVIVNDSQNPGTSTPLNETPDSTQFTDTAPNTPASITTSAVLEIEEYIELLDAEDEEADPDRLRRDLEINERVNRSLAEAEEAALARSILSPRAVPAERKTVQFADDPIIGPVGEEDALDIGEGEVVMKTVYVWNTFRDFVSVSSLTGFEEYVLEPRIWRTVKDGVLQSQNTKERPDIESIPKLADLDEMVTEMPSADFKAESDNPASNEIDVIAPDPAIVAISASRVTVTETEPEKTSKYEPLMHPKIQVTERGSGLDGFPSIVEVVKPEGTSVLGVSSDVATDAVTPEVEVGSRLNVVPVEPLPSQIPPIKLTTSLNPEISKSRNKLTHVNFLKDIEPADVENTWNMPSTPLVEVDIGRNIENRRDSGGFDPFLEGLSVSKAPERKDGKKTVVIEEPKAVEISLEAQGVPLRGPSKVDSTSSGVDVSSSAMSAYSVKLTQVEPPPTPGPHTFAAISSYYPKKEGNHASIPSQIPFHPSLQRSGIPVPVPVPPKATPAIKSPPKSPNKPSIAPKPSNLIGTPRGGNKSKGNTIFSPLVGGLVDPFLASLQPTVKKETPPVRPKTPSTSTDSASSTPTNSEVTHTQQEQLKWPSIDTSLAGAIIASAPTSPTSLSSSWTFVENTKKDILTKVVSPPAPPSRTPARRTWFGSESKSFLPPSSMDISATTSSNRPASTGVSPRADEPSSSTVQPGSSPQGRKLFTFELKVGQSIVSTPVHELDNPREVAEQFAREHDLQNRLPGGQTTVAEIVGYFESQFAERKKERERKRAERRERSMKAAVW